MERNNSYRIALCSMATALAVLILALGHSLGVGEFFWYYVAALLMDLPERTIDKTLCVLTTIVLSAVLCGFNYVYLISFGALMAPYVVVKAAVRNRSGMVQYWAVTAAAFCGLMAIAWWTPMFFLQLNSVQSITRRWIAAGILLLVSMGFEPLYGRLYRIGKKILLKVWFRTA